MFLESINLLPGSLGLKSCYILTACTSEHRTSRSKADVIAAVDEITLTAQTRVALPGPGQREADGSHRVKGGTWTERGGRVKTTGIRGLILLQLQE